MVIGKDTKKLIVFSCLFTTYLIFGALIFRALEIKNERQEKLLIRESRKIFNEKYNISAEDWRKLETIVQHRFNVNTTVWSFGNAFIFAGSVITTVGYGNIVPYTANGRAFCIVYALLGIPLTCLTLKAIGEKLCDAITALMKRVKTRLARTNEENVRKESILLMNIFLWVATLVSLAWLAVWRRGWTWLEGLYFCFITFSTIGFGDYVAFDENEANSATDYFVVFIGVVLGFAVTSTVLLSLASLMDDSLEKKTRREGSLVSRFNQFKNRFNFNRNTTTVEPFSNNNEENRIKKVSEQNPTKDKGATENVIRRNSFKKANDVE